MNHTVVQPAMRVLPFGDDAITWERFESFSLALVRALPDVRRAERYGQNGQAQQGIDIEADLIDGRRRTIQCRRRKRFTRATAQKVVGETTYEADEHEIWATCGIGVAVSDYITGLPGWSVRGGEGISQTVRELPRERARRVVEDGFGAAVRRAFLGPDGPIAFESPEDHFAALNAPERLLRHDLDLVGRAGDLSTLLEAVRTPEAKVVVLPGRGGIGKTRLLRAAAEELTADGARVLLARPGAELTLDAVDDLPLQAVTVIVDDAHLRDVELRPLLGAITRRADPLTLLLAVRPAGVDGVRETARETDLDFDRILVLEPLKSLDEASVIALAGAAAGETSDASIRLAMASRDSPLVTVIGGRLLAAGRLGPEPTGGADFREAVLARFSAELLGALTPTIPDQAARRLATLLAAVQPLDLDDELLLRAIAEELAVTTGELRRWLGELEAAGLMLVRGSMRRLTPDALAEQLLAQACLDRSARPTGYANELWMRFGALATENLLANLAELAWRPGGESLFKPIWGQVESEFHAGDAGDRAQILDKVHRVAFHLPAVVLSLVQIALEDSAQAENRASGDGLLDHSTLRSRLPAILRAAGRRPDHAAAVMAILWKLARDDGRPPHSDPEHPLRILTELGGYEQSPAHQTALLDLVESQAGRPDADEHIRSPVTLLDPLLAREGIGLRPTSDGIHMLPYAVKPEATAHVRSRARSILVDQAIHGSSRQSLEAVRLFRQALELPHGYFGNAVDGAVRDSWMTDQEAVLDAAERVEEGVSDPLVRETLSNALEWHAEHSPWPTAKHRAADLRKRLAGPEEELVAAITNPWGLHDLEAQHERDKRVARTLLAQHPDGRSLAQAFSVLLDELALRGSEPMPGEVLARVCQASPAHAKAIWEWALEHPDASLSRWSGIGLDVMRREGEPMTELFLAGRKSTDLGIRRALAHYLSLGAWFSAPHDFELEALGAIMADGDDAIQRMMSTTLLRLRSTEPLLAARLALQVPVDAAHADNDTLFATIRETGLQALSEQDLDRLCSRLVAVPELEHFGHQLLGDLAARDADRALAVWLTRLNTTVDERQHKRRYQAVPFDEPVSDMFAGSADDRRRALTKLLRGASGFDYLRQRELGRLFWRLAVPGLDGLADHEPSLPAERVSEALATFTAWGVDVRTDDDLVSSVSYEMPWQILLAAPEKVDELLATAEPPRRETLRDGLHAAAFGGAFGEVRLTRLEQRAEEIARELPSDSAAALLYADIARAADKTREREPPRYEEDRWE